MLLVLYVGWFKLLILNRGCNSRWQVEDVWVMLGCNGDEKVPHTAKPRLSTKYIQTYVQEDVKGDVKEDVKQEDVNRGCKRLG